MDRSIVPTLVEALGVQKAAEQFLNRHPKELDPDAEQFFLEQWSILADPTLFVWLSRKAPAGATTRPASKIVPKLVEWLVAQAESDPFAAINLPHWIGGIVDALVRDDLVEQLRGRLPENVWERLLPHAAGCRAFSLIAAFDLREHQHKHDFPHGLVGEGPIPELRGQLFDVRREETKIIERLRSIISDERIGSYALWVLRELDLLKQVVTPELLLDGLPTIKELGLEGRTKVRFKLELASDLSDAPTFKVTVMKRILDASARGVPWGFLWWEILEALRDDVGLASIDTERPAPWALASVERRLKGVDAWRKRLDFLERPEPDLEEHAHFHRGAVLWSGRPFQKGVLGEDEFFPRIDLGWLISGPLPEDADEAFEQRLEEALRRIYHYDERIIWDRLAELPLTQERATHIVGKTLDDGTFYDLTRCDEIAEACGKLDRVIPRPSRSSPKGLRAYGLLAGNPAASSMLFDEAISLTDFHAALELAKIDDSLRSTVNLERLRKLVPRDDLRTLIRLQTEHGWLLSESEVASELAGRTFPDDQWRWMGKSLPTYLLPILEAKAASTASPELAGELLGRLKQMEVGPTRLATIAVERVVTLGTTAMAEHRIGDLLTSGRLWEGPGKVLLGHVLRCHGQTGGLWLCDVVFRAAQKKENLVAAMHAVLAKVLIEMADEALRREDNPAAERFLRALVCLTAPPRLFKEVRALGKLTKEPPIRRLLEANEGLMRRADNEAATLDALLEALTTCSNEAPDTEDAS